MVLLAKSVTRAGLLIHSVFFLQFACLPAYASPVSKIQPNNAGFWQGSAESDGPAQPAPLKPGFAKPGATYETDESFDRYYQKINKQLKQRVALISLEISKHWPSVEMSGKSIWVEYGADWRSKRVVDYASNEIRVSSLEDMSHIEVKEFALSELKGLLGMTILAALRHDPGLAPIMSIDAESYLDDKLVFSELFKSEKPSSNDIARLAQRLMLRAYVRYQDQIASRGNADLSKKVTYVIPLPKSRMRDKAREYLPYVKKYSNEFQIPADVMMAIMHTESHFNPLARSHVPAFGLMQIVPRTAGRDASGVLFNKKKLLSAGFLYKPDNNIRVGAAYLNVLSFRYLKKIENPVSRLYCMVAAYNTGSANVARAFTHVPKMQKAVTIINRMSNQQVLMRLIKYLPQRETRDYVEKVLKRRKAYSRV